MNKLFDEPDKAYISFEYRNLGKTVRIENEYDYDVCWHEILSDVVAALEGSYGYTFDLENSDLSEVRYLLQR